MKNILPVGEKKRPFQVEIFQPPPPQGELVFAIFKRHCVGASRSLSTHHPDYDNRNYLGTQGNPFSDVIRTSQRTHDTSTLLLEQ